MNHFAIVQYNASTLVNVMENHIAKACIRSSPHDVSGAFASKWFAWLCVGLGMAEAKGGGAHRKIGLPDIRLHKK